MPCILDAMLEISRYCLEPMHHVILLAAFQAIIKSSGSKSLVFSLFELRMQGTAAAELGSLARAVAQSRCPAALDWYVIVV